ncbi:XRE family transcriptional regulator [Anaerocolumna sp. AGMB13025]|uniref:XRE family transcriptional regulator n=1 Tax=Anaerocolumna sp. AGMB13025 TaxID=3039116 RepID=UPI00241F3AB5|nr:XRE family transcriptional regulator [Anaerocolumna sp. AGMB13025]WFR59448.1 XRE family transcriptional regulator [Anaerocolumna sp. AGMB13025]
MNKVEIMKCSTPYNYDESYLVIDGKSIVMYLNEWVKAGKCKRLEKFNSLLGVYPAWGKELVWEADKHFIYELLVAKDTLNVPILVCEDDLDFSCIVILARIRKEHNYVYWDKIGLLNHDSEDFIIEKKSGILFTEAYNDDDWKNYGDNIALTKVDSKEWCDWISKNWYDELLRRRRNYTKPYMQNDKNIIWIENVNWSFDEKDYRVCMDWYAN